MPFSNIYQASDYTSAPPQQTWAQYLDKYNSRAREYQHTTRQQAPYYSAAANPDQGSALATGQMYSGYQAKQGTMPNANHLADPYVAQSSGSDFSSDPNLSYRQQLQKDWLQDFKNPAYQITAAAVPGWNNVRAYQSFSSHQKSRKYQDEFFAAQRQQATEQRHAGILKWAIQDPQTYYALVKRFQQGGDVSDAELEQIYHQRNTELQQADLTNRVNQYFDDPLRQVRSNQAIDAQSANSLNQLADQYNMLSTKAAQNAAARGMLGSSVDISHRGQLGRARDSAALGVANQAASDRAAFDTGSNAYKQQLLALINSGNPAAAAQAQNQLAGLDQMTQSQLDLINSRTQGQAINDFANGAYSQVLGGGLNAGASAINAYGPYLYQYMNRGQ